MRMSLKQCAKEASGRSRMCAKCPINLKHKICSEDILQVCHNAFVNGYLKGAKDQKK